MTSRGGETQISTLEVPASAGEALALLVAAGDAAGRAGFPGRYGCGEYARPAAGRVPSAHGANRHGAGRGRGQVLAAFDAQDGSVADGQRMTRTWLVNVTRVTKGQAAEYRGLQGLAERHRPLHAGLAEADVITKSEALALARMTRAIPEEYGAQAEDIVIAAARAGADQRALAAIIAEILVRTAPPVVSAMDRLASH